MSADGHPGDDAPPRPSTWQFAGGALLTGLLVALGVPLVLRILGIGPTLDREYTVIYAADAPELGLLFYPIALLSIAVWAARRLFAEWRAEGTGRRTLAIATLLAAASTGMCHNAHSRFPGGDAPPEARRAWADETFGAWWNAVERAVAADPDVRARLGTPVRVTPVEGRNSVAYFFDFEPPSAGGTFTVAVEGPKGRADGRFRVETKEIDAAVPPRWGMAVDDRVEVKGTVTFEGRVKRKVEAAYPLAERP